MTDQTGRLVAFGLFSVAASIVLAAAVYSHATPRYTTNFRGGLVDTRTGEAFGALEEGDEGEPNQYRWHRAIPPVSESEFPERTNGE